MLRGIARRGDLVQGTDTLWYELIQQATSAQGFQLRFMARGLSRGSPCGKHLRPLLASPGANTKHLVVCFLLTHNLFFSMLVLEKSNISSSYLCTARLDSLKRVDLIVKAFLSMPDKKLIVTSGGPELDRLKRLARDASNVIFADWVGERGAREERAQQFEAKIYY